MEDYDMYDIYEEEKAEQLLEDDELSPAEQAFMRGYDEELT